MAIGAVAIEFRMRSRRGRPPPRPRRIGPPPSSAQGQCRPPRRPASRSSAQARGSPTLPRRTLDLRVRRPSLNGAGAQRVGLCAMSPLGHPLPGLARRYRDRTWRPALVTDRLRPTAGAPAARAPSTGSLHSHKLSPPRRGSGRRLDCARNYGTSSGRASSRTVVSGEVRNRLQQGRRSSRCVMNVVQAAGQALEFSEDRRRLPPSAAPAHLRRGCSWPSPAAVRRLRNPAAGKSGGAGFAES
jgi:hypothetical protein